ncbi:U4/U6 small nuclear ribonucleoprotein PRP4-like protein [Striga hermonthica]|uniref:U4/U6 small nuclear ribonucleoprotein PRP4-like protein n=1 Tax=Striga hermonthica TaxID=68872 RepID=A0A9N7NVD1_STRHE|nr:U4/U6 small nuclear ribonucleoprotein PRP4-like protein [Striga hermonthica]
MPDVKKVSSLKGHTERATDVAFSPINHQLAIASADRTARLWNHDGSALRTFEGHLDRLARIAFHPSGKYLGTASFDKTWRLWDVDTAAPCGLDSLARVWDLRSGKSILAFEGHVKPALAVKFEPQEGYFLVTASYDMTAKIWSSRDFKPVKTLSDHESKVTSLDIVGDGQCIATVSHDRTIKLWSARESEKEKDMEFD